MTSVRLDLPGFFESLNANSYKFKLNFSLNNLYLMIWRRDRLAYTYFSARIQLSSLHEYDTGRAFTNFGEILSEAGHSSDSYRSIRLQDKEKDEEQMNQITDQNEQEHLQFISENLEDEEDNDLRVTRQRSSTLLGRLQEDTESGVSIVLLMCIYRIIMEELQSFFS